MSYRFMRMIVMFDLPTVTSEERRAYRRFRKNLISNGFFMMQESIYVKMSINAAACEGVIKKIEKIKPQSGLVQILQVTERQFEKMQILVGKAQSDVISTDERLVIL